MTAGNDDTDNAEACTALPRADAVPIAPHILIAEDQPAIRDLLCWTLQLAGYRTAVCAGRHAALTWRDQAMPYADLPVLLLLDMSLFSTKESADFLRHVRAHWQDADGVQPQIIVLTTNTQMQEDLVPRERVLQKPFHIRDLIALIQQVIPVAS